MGKRRRCGKCERRARAIVRTAKGAVLFRCRGCLSRKLDIKDVGFGASASGLKENQVDG